MIKDIWNGDKKKEREYLEWVKKNLEKNTDIYVKEIKRLDDKIAVIDEEIRAQAEVELK